MLGMDRSSRRYSRCGGSSPWRAFARPLGAHIFCYPLPQSTIARVHFLDNPSACANDVLGFTPQPFKRNSDGRQGLGPRPSSAQPIIRLAGRSPKRWSARRALVIRARPFRYAVVTLVATAERRGPRRNTASIRYWVRRIIDVMVRLTEAGCELRYTLPQGLRLRSAVCASHPT